MKLKKLAALLLSAALLLTAFAGCNGGGESKSESESTPDSSASGPEGETSEGGEESTGEPEELTLPISEDGAELEVWTVYEGTLYKDPNDIKGVQKTEELTGVHINWIPVSQSVIADQFGILLTSGDYPDIIFPPVGGYPGGYEKGIEDGVIYPDIADLIDQYMPNYKAYLDSSEDVRREATTDSGIQMLRVIVGADGEAKSEGTVMSLAYRKDMLDQLGMEEPTTIDEWYQVLTAAKNELGVEYPLMLGANGGSDRSLAWGVSTGSQYFVQMDGDTVTSGLLQEGFGQYLDTMKQWYSEGLIDPNFTSFNYYLDTPASVENNDKLLYSTVLSGFSGQNYYSMKMVTNEEAYLQPVVAPVLEEGDEAIQCGDRVVAGDMVFISSSCEDPVLAAKWLDFLYSEDGELCLWYGIEGETYELDENGEPQLLESIIDNPDGLSAGDYMQKFALNRGNCWLGKNNWQAGAKLNELTSGNNTQMEAVETWSVPEVNIAYPTRGVTLTEEESDMITVNATSLNTLIQEYMVNYIIGSDSTAPADFQATLDDYGYQRVIDAYQAAYDRYMAR